MEEIHRAWADDDKLFLTIAEYCKNPEWFTMSFNCAPERFLSSKEFMFKAILFNPDALNYIPILDD